MVKNTVFSEKKTTITEYTFLENSFNFLGN